MLVKKDTVTLSYLQYKLTRDGFFGRDRLEILNGPKWAANKTFVGKTGSLQFITRDADDMLSLRLEFRQRVLFGVPIGPPFIIASQAFHGQQRFVEEVPSENQGYLIGYPPIMAWVGPHLMRFVPRLPTSQE